MTRDELRHAMKMDAQACEEISIGFDNFVPDAEALTELQERAASLVHNIALYRVALARDVKP